jgi:hypothetical protein
MKERRSGTEKGAEALHLLTFSGLFFDVFGDIADSGPAR